MKVPQLSPFIGVEEYEAIKASIESNWITEGPRSKEFSEKLLKLIGSRYGVFAPNGTLAIYLGLKALGVGSGDEVIVPDFTFIASATAVEMTGATPVFVDVNRKNFQIDLSKAHKLVSKKTKAIMPVHIYGTVCDMDEVIAFAKKHKLLVIEDAAEAIAVHWKGKHAGSFGEVGCFSFFADKTITTGEGGFIVTDDKEIYENLLYLRNQGRVDRGSFIHPRMGYNFRMTDIQSAMGLAQLAKLEEIKKRKKHIHDLYMKLLKGTQGLTFFKPESYADWIPFRMVVFCEDAHELMAFMKARNIEPRTFFYPLHKQPPFSSAKNNYKDRDLDFANTIYGYEHGVCLPIFPTLTDKQVEYVCSTIKEFLNRDIFYQYYDVIYRDKDYKEETQMVFDLSKKYGLGEPGKILEIGCGTGNHTKELASKGVDLVAIDIDAKMVEIAKKKLKTNKGRRVSILETSVEKMHEGKFDLALALFNVVTYIDGTENLKSFIQGVSRNLKDGGIFVFDAWNGAAALLDPPKPKRTVIKNGAETVEAYLNPVTDILNQKTIMSYTIKASRGKKKTVGGTFFNQSLWTPREIVSALESSGLELLFYSPFMKPNEKATEKDWKIMYCARKKGS